MILHLKTKTLSWPNSMLQLSPHFAVPLYIGALKNKMLCSISRCPVLLEPNQAWVPTILLKWHLWISPSYWKSIIQLLITPSLSSLCATIFSWLVFHFTGHFFSSPLLVLHHLPRQMLGGSHSPVALYFIQRISQSLFSSLQVSAWWITHPSDSAALSPVLPSAFHSPPATLAPWTKTPFTLLPCSFCPGCFFWRWHVTSRELYGWLTHLLQGKLSPKVFPDNPKQYSNPPRSPSTISLSYPICVLITLCYTMCLFFFHFPLSSTKM